MVDVGWELWSIQNNLNFISFVSLYSKQYCGLRGASPLDGG